jgi:uncharacterized protein YjbI with pentapeptide repeats
VYVNVRFDQADLRNTDLRQSSFENCSFVDADMSGAVSTRKEKTSLVLSEKQIAQVSSVDEDGEEPDGG